MRTALSRLIPQNAARSVRKVSAQSRPSASGATRDRPPVPIMSWPLSAGSSAGRNRSPQEGLGPEASGDSVGLGLLGRRSASYDNPFAQSHPSGHALVDGGDAGATCLWVKDSGHVV